MLDGSTSGGSQNLWRFTGLSQRPGIYAKGNRSVHDAGRNISRVSASAELAQQKTGGWPETLTILN